MYLFWNNAMVLSGWRIKKWVAVVGFLAFLLAPKFANGEGKILRNEWRNPLPQVFADVWNGFNPQQDRPETQVFVELLPAELMFIKNRDGYTAKYELDIAIYQRQNHQKVDSKTFVDTVQIREYEQIYHTDRNRFFKEVFSLANGEYFAEITVTDLNIDKVFSIAVPFTVELEKRYDVDVSDIMFGKKEVIQLNGEKPFGCVLPDARRVYGIEREVLYYFFEVYTETLSPKDTVSYAVHLMRADGSAELVQHGELPLKRHKIPVMGVLNTKDLPPGKVDLQVTILPEEGLLHLERRKLFSIYQSPTDLRFRSVETVLDELRLIATDEEWRFFQDLQTAGADVAAFQAAIDAFWMERDPTPSTVFNELMNEFYQRANTARIVFQLDDAEPLYVNDRSRIFVMMGQPERIVRQVDELTSGYLEIWYYPAHNLQVVFRDDFGFGDFRLLTPENLLSDIH
jgi:GWxTD domain-containing protein